MVLRVLIVQHGEKERLPGDPGLTDLGQTQAQAVAGQLGGGETPVAIWSSPLRRATETAGPIAAQLGLDVLIEPRLRERMNWEGPLESLDGFLDDWRRATVDRSYVPRHGDSSEQAARRFLAALDDIARAQLDGSVVVVAHGGVTVDVLRTLMGDGPLMASAPTLLDDGVPAGAITTLRRARKGWAVESLSTTSHLSRDPS